MRMSNPELPTTVLAPDKHLLPLQWPALLIPCATPSLRDEVTEAALLPCDRCLSEQELGEGGNRTDGVRFSSPAPRSPAPAAPVGFGKTTTTKKSNLCLMRLLGHPSCTVSTLWPGKTQWPRSRPGSLSQSRVRVGRTQRKTKGP